MNRSYCVVLVLAALACRVSLAAPRLRVDVNVDTDRKDVLTPGWENWRFAKGPSATKTFGGATVTLRSGEAGKNIASDWWKGGLDYDATLTSDGAFVEGGGALEMVLHGLAPGKHTLVTYHNLLSEQQASPFDVWVGDDVRLKGVVPSVKVTQRDDSATSYVEFEASEGKDELIRFVPSAGNTDARVIINGFEIDRPDPARQASKPMPADGDEHVAENPELAWRAAKSAAAHEVYFGTDPDRIAEAGRGSPEFVGKQAAGKLSLGDRKLDSLKTYYWRVDELFDDSAHAGGQTTVKGEVWSFRIRHLAFPGAEGYGRFAIGGRGGRVIEVTNLDDSGPGSLRAACEAEGPRTVVFRVGGIITLKDRVVVNHPYLTLAGQTAPGDGICVRGAAIGGSGAHDVIFRYLRVRVGDESGKTWDGMGLRGCDHSIIDHCSISWTIDESVSSREARNITVQRCLIAEALNMSVHAHYQNTGKGHSFAGSISGNIGSFHHNLIANCAGRNWSLAGGYNKGNKLAGYLDIRNNVVYNWQHRTTDGGVKELNYVNNLYIPGPATRFLLLLRPEVSPRTDLQRYYMSGNVLEGHPEFDDDNWKASDIDWKTTPHDPQYISLIREDKPFFESFVTTQSAKDAYENVLADVGAKLPKQDALDQRAIREVRNRNHDFVGSKTQTPGIIDSQADVGGWPEYASAEPPADSDDDGIPDAWERDHGLDPHNPADAAVDSTGDGYTNLENYLNGILGSKGSG